MDKSKLIEKRDAYIKLKDECESGNYPAEILSKIEEFEKQIKAEYDITRAEDLSKANHYIELLDELINEANDEIKDEPISKPIEEMDIVDRIIASANE